MSEHIPQRPEGNSAAARFMQAVWEKLWGSSSKQNFGPFARTMRTTRGVSIVPVAQTVKRGTALETYIVRQEQFDRLLCYPVGGIGDGTDDVIVYKPDELVNTAYVVCWFNMWSIRYDPLSLVVNGVLTPSPNKRFSRWENTADPLLNQAYKEVIWPPYVQQPTPPGQLAPPSNPRLSYLLIYAAEDDNGRLVDVNTGRWQRKWHKEIVVCTKNGNKLALVPSSHVYDAPIDFSTI